MIPQHLNLIKLSVCQYLLKDILVFSVVLCLVFPSADTVHCLQVLGDNWLVELVCSVLTAMLELIDMSTPRVPSENDDGGLYTDVFLQITCWANIQQPSIA